MDDSLFCKTSNQVKATGKIYLWKLNLGMNKEFREQNKVVVSQVTGVKSCMKTCWSPFSLHDVIILVYKEAIHTYFRDKNYNDLGKVNAARAYKASANRFAYSVTSL